MSLNQVPSSWCLCFTLVELTEILRFLLVLTRTKMISNLREIMKEAWERGREHHRKHTLQWRCRWQKCDALAHSDRKQTQNESERPGDCQHTTRHSIHWWWRQREHHVNAPVEETVKVWDNQVNNNTKLIIRASRGFTRMVKLNLEWQSRKCLRSAYSLPQCITHHGQRRSSFASVCCLTALLYKNW